MLLLNAPRWTAPCKSSHSVCDALLIPSRRVCESKGSLVHHFSDLTSIVFKTTTTSLSAALSPSSSYYPEFESRVSSAIERGSTYSSGAAPGGFFGVGSRGMLPMRRKRGLDTLASGPVPRRARASSKRREEVRAVLHLALARASGDLRRACGQDHKYCRWEGDMKRYILRE